MKRFSYSFSLLRSLREIMPKGGATGRSLEPMRESIDAKVDACLRARTAGWDGIAANLYHLMRARDILRYLVEEPELQELKLDLFSAMLREQDTEARWDWIRHRLIDHLLPGLSLPGTAALRMAELHGQISLRTSPLGRLLQAVALFNFDTDEEAPPSNLTVVFPAGRFPDHDWQWNEAGRMRGHGTSWAPARPLSRWEYLASDLAVALFQTVPHAQPVPGAATLDAPPVEEEVPLDAELTALYCRTLPRQDEPGGTEQLELLRLEPGCLLPALQRQVHRALGAEGVRLFVLLMEHVLAAPPGRPVSLPLLSLVQVTGEEGVTRAILRRRARKMERVLDIVAHQEVHRVFTPRDQTCENQSPRDQCRLEMAPLLAVLGRWKTLPSEAREIAREPVGKGEDPLQFTLRVLPDRLLAGPGSPASLALRYSNIPPALLRLSPREHPMALGLYIHVRCAWQTAQGSATAINQSARQLIEEAGFWLKPSARYRTVELLKAELHYLRETGFLGRWRIRPGNTRDLLEERYRIEPPAHGGATEAPPLRHLA